MSEEFKDFSEAFKGTEFTSSVISCSQGHDVAVLKTFKNEEDQFTKDWIDSFSGKCPRCQSALSFKICDPSVYEQWASREDLRYMGHE
jgi:hypothetical protein